MPKPALSGPHSDIDGLHRSDRDGDENRHRESGTADEQMQDDRKSKPRPPQNGQKPGGIC